MKKICIILFATFALPGIFASTAQAKPYHHTTVNWVVANRDNLGVDDNYVTLVGHVTRRMGDEEYWFTDGTGSVRLDSENFDLPLDTRIVVGGRIDEAYLGFGHLEVDVRHWHYAPLGKRVTHAIVIRPATPPPAPAASPERAPTPPPITTPAAAAPVSTPAEPVNTAPTTTTTTTTTSNLTPPADASPSGTNVTAPPGK
jgi:uncharacterized protein YdeI (BOF family)